MNYQLVIFNHIHFLQASLLVLRGTSDPSSSISHRTLQSPVFTLATQSPLRSESELHLVHIWGMWKGKEEEYIRMLPGRCKQCYPHADEVFSCRGLHYMPIEKCPSSHSHCCYPKMGSQPNSMSTKKVYRAQRFGTNGFHNCLSPYCSYKAHICLFSSLCPLDITTHLLSD